MISIVGSVGKAGNNFKNDVILVQELLNRSTATPKTLLAIDGFVGYKTIEMIYLFQQRVVGFTPPDSLIEPNGRTWKQLRRYHSDSPTTFEFPFLVFPASVPDYPALGLKKIAWGKKVSVEFKSKVIKIAINLNVSPDYLMACMAFETGETFSPNVKNAAGSGATGLIQFMPATAEDLNTTTEKLSKMTAVQQLDYVELYLKRHKNKFKKLEDVYMAILYPAAIGKPLTHGLFKKGTKTYTQNRGLDRNKDGNITLEEVSAKVRAKYEKGLKSGYLG